MSLANTRIIKEARALFWTWCAVTAAVGLKWVPSLSGYNPRFFHDASLLAFWFGIPLMATLSLGLEFEYRTLPLLLSQPSARGKLWTQKWVILLAGILSAAAIYWFCWRAPFTEQPDLIFVAAASAISVCSAMFWTLVARSTIGGLTLTALQAVVIFFIGDITYSLMPLPAVLAGVVYALVMLLLGRRKLARFQATGEAAGDDLLTSRETARRSFLSGWLSPSPSGALLNLIRKELRLLWPAWLLTLSTLIFLLAAASVHFTRGWVVAIFMVALGSLLAGSLSMGEETTLGMRSSLMTIPMAVRTQWLTKLLIAQSASLLCALGFVIAGQAFFGASFLLSQEAGDLLLASAFVCFTAFWCSCAVKGTVRAVLWVFPAIALIGIAVGSGVSLGTQLIRYPFGSLLSQLHPYPFAKSTETLLNEVLYSRYSAVWAVPPLLFMLIQSYRLFRTEPRDDVSRPIRYVALLTVVFFLTTFFHQLPFAIIVSANENTWKVLGEVSKAVAKMPLDTKKLTAGEPITLTLDDFAQSSPLSDLARRSLNNTISVTPREIQHRHQWDRINRRWVTQNFSYFTTVQLKNNWKCSVYGADGFVFSCETPGGRWGYPKFP